MQKKFIKDLLISNIQWINQEYFIIQATHNEILPEMYPGHFAEILVENSKNTFLRRPLSIHDVDYSNNTVYFLVQVVGSGTSNLGKLKKGDLLNSVFPLGNSYSIPSHESKVLLVGGGCGVAPLLFLARTLHSNHIHPDIIIGGKTSEHLLRIEEYKKYGQVYFTTENGSLGDKGFVIHSRILLDENRKYDKIYTCGPEPMMKAIAKYAAKKGIDCEVSLENMMACGIGACLCCVVDTKTGHKCTCTDGPVFNINELKWLT
ncbi:MAG: dihydroorotate dehydrogenase electron transfer subunit [Bacteroidales bacterium]|nr:dihydroorotate dehydrogenase electron transfer subunit [Bacteroidales bacterium]